MGYYVLVALHVLAASIWFGGIVMMAAVVVPTARTLKHDLRRRLIDEIGRRFRTIGWLALATLYVTGTLMVISWGVTWDQIMNGVFFEAERNLVLTQKVAMVAAMTVISFLHDWVLGPRSLKIPPGGREEAQAKVRARILAMLTLLLTVLIIVWAVRVARPWLMH